MTSKLLQAAVIKSLGLRGIAQWQRFSMCEALRTTKPRKFGTAIKDTAETQVPEMTSAERIKRTGRGHSVLR